MNKKACTVVITVVCFLSIVALMVGYMLREGIISTDNLFYKNNDNIQNESGTEAGDKNLKYPTYKVLLKEGAEFNLQYTDSRYKRDEYSDIYVKFNSVEITKEMKDFDPFGDWDEIKDENGTIINDYSYIICNVTIKNKGNFDIDTGINCLHLCFGTDGYYTEMRSYNSGRPVTHLKDYYLFTLKSGVEYNYNTVFVDKDSYINKYRSNLLLLTWFLEDFKTIPNLPIIDKQ